MSTPPPFLAVKRILAPQSFNATDRDTSPPPAPGESRARSASSQAASTGLIPSVFGPGRSASPAPPAEGRISSPGLAGDPELTGSGPKSERFGGPAGPVSERFGGPAGPVSERFGGPAGPVSERFGGLAGPVSERFGGPAGPVSERFGGLAGPVSERFAAAASGPLSRRMSQGRLWRIVCRLEARHGAFLISRLILMTGIKLRSYDAASPDEPSVIDKLERALNTVLSADDVEELSPLFRSRG